MEFIFEKSISKHNYNVADLMQIMNITTHLIPPFQIAHHILNYSRAAAITSLNIYKMCRLLVFALDLAESMLTQER